MLETFRKYTGLMFVVLILLFAGLVLLESSGSAVFSGPKVIYAHGKGYTAQEVNRFAQQPARMLTELSRLSPGGGRSVGAFLFQMGVFGARLEDDQIFEFLVNRASLHKAMKTFGVAASTAEVEQYLREELFWADGEFNAQAYAEFTDNTLNKLGMSVKQMNDLVGEVIAFEKLPEILGAGVDVSRDAVLARHLASSQRVTYQLVSLPLAEFEAEQTPTEEELKAYWEEHKAKYRSEPKRRLTYLLARPDFVALEQAKQQPEGGADAPKPAEGDAPANESEAPAPPADSALSEEERKAAVIEVATKMDGMLDKLDNADGEGFEQFAEELGFEVKTTELVTSENLPSELQADLADVPGKTAADLIFETRVGDDPISSFGEIKKVGTDQWLFFRLDEVVEPVELSYEEAKEKGRSDLVRESARKDLEQAANDKRAALLEALAAEKSFEEAAQELELTVTSHPVTTRPVGGDSAALAAFNLAARTNPGELSEVEIDTGTGPDAVNRAILAFVEKREVYENTNLDTLIDRQVDQTRQRLQEVAFSNWFAVQRTGADVRFPGSP